MSENKPTAVTDDDFEQQVLNTTGIKVVDFWAPWCGPCHTMTPALESFAEKNGDLVRVFKLDVDDNPKTAEKFRIRSIPTIIFFKDGRPAETWIGALSEPALQEKLDALLHE